MRTKPLFGLTLILMSLTVGSAWCSGEVRQGNEVLIEHDEVINDDVYVFAKKATINGIINGDLVVFAQQITVNGAVDGDFIGAAQQVVINGAVSDDVRIAGQVLTLQSGADIGDDLIAASNSLECKSESRIGGMVRYAGYQSILAGYVGQKVDLASANCELSGRFGGSINALVEGGSFGPIGVIGAEVPAIPMGLTVTSAADISGDLNYQSTREADIHPDSEIAGEVEHNQTESDDAKPLTFMDRVVAFAKQFFALLLIGLLIVFVCPKWTGQVVATIEKRPLASIAWGLLSMIAVIAAAILLLVATIAIAILLGMISLDNLLPAWIWLGALSTAVVVVGFWIYFVWITKVVVGVWLGNRILSNSAWDSPQRIIALALGILIFAALSWIPIAGTVVSLLVMLMGLGSTSLWLLSKPETAVAGKPQG